MQRNLTKKNVYLKYCSQDLIVTPEKANDGTAEQQMEHNVDSVSTSDPKK